MRIEYFEYMAFETSVAQSRNLVLEYHLANITFLQINRSARKVYVLTKAKNMPFSAKRRYKSKLTWGFASGIHCQPYSDFAMFFVYMVHWSLKIIPILQKSELLYCLHKSAAKTKGQ